MTDPPLLLLYRRDGCHLCDETRAILDALLAERAAAGRPTAPVREIDVATDADLEARFAFTIPVLEGGGERLELATSAGAIRRFLDRVLDGAGEPERVIP
ncbi:MAG: hypothetical protein KatS3mg065_0413 [Chloroflexota bacterium]|nr:MAG: hypothetical protein KatS3mg065_0413 [Chloroflexota bacterium]